MAKITVDQFAQQNDYECAEFICEWHGYKCYEPILVKGQVSYIGMPMMIMEDQHGNFRMSTSKETMQMIDEIKNN